MGLEDVQLACVNHPRTTTRVRCSNCDSPICVRCMHETPVGMKCPACARVEIRNPRDRRRYAAGAAGLILAGLLTAGAVLLFSRLNLLVAILLGVAIGAAVRKAGGEQPRLGGTAALSAICGMALGVLVLGAPYPILFSPAFWIPGAIAAGSAGLVASR